MFNKKTVIATLLIGGLVGFIANESYEQGARDLGHEMVRLLETFKESIKESEQEEA